MRLRLNRFVAVTAVAFSAAAASQTTSTTSTTAQPTTTNAQSTTGSTQPTTGTDQTTAPGQTGTTPEQMQSMPGDASTMTPSTTGQTPSGQTPAQGQSTPAPGDTTAALKPAKESDLKKGASVYDTDGKLVGKIESVSSTGAVVSTGKTRGEIALTSFGLGDKGLVIAMTREEMNAAAAKAKKK